MIGVLSLLLVLTLSITITRIATVALAHTGLSYQVARFQARSAFTGVGFTTTEAEQVVTHPLRRRILMIIMLVGNAGIVTSMTSLIVTFTQQGNESGYIWRVILLIAGVTILWAAVQSHWIERRMATTISWALNKWTGLKVIDYADLLHLGGEYQVSELNIRADDWLANKTLAAAQLRNEGVVVLGIERPNGDFDGVPRGTTRIHPNDVLIIYGHAEAIKSLDQRHIGWNGDLAHEKAVDEHRRFEAEKEQKDKQDDAQDQK
jgi:hypothetical protein